MQFYEGKADWDAIRAVRDVISVPLVANGDVETPDDAQEILRRSGADAVMIGRGCQGRPWHAGVLAGEAESGRRAQFADIVVEHYEMMLDFYGAGNGSPPRAQASWLVSRAFRAVASGCREGSDHDIARTRTKSSRAFATLLAGGSELSESRGGGMTDKATSRSDRRRRRQWRCSTPFRTRSSWSMRAGLIAFANWEAEAFFGASAIASRTLQDLHLHPVRQPAAGPDRPSARAPGAGQRISRRPELAASWPGQAGRPLCRAG